ncbi:hypothetical protein FRB95_007563 [Tulasnella sp. JGI-2019a]|nr:hypothetical protein FRB95_007563 [Tulasnella sp. JGI-2019a]
MPRSLTAACLLVALSSTLFPILFASSIKTPLISLRRHHGPLKTLHRRAGTFPAGWSTTSQCLQDSSTTRILSNQLMVANNMTLEYCVSLCDAAGYLYCGAQYYSECWGGNSIVTSGGGGAVLPASSCNYPCKGNTTENCGGSYIATVFTKSGAPTTTPATFPSGWNTTSQCLQDSSTTRILSKQLLVSNNMTLEYCVTICNAAGYSYCGAQYYSECWGGNSIVTSGGGGAVLPASSCSYPCKGNTSENCGGSYIATVFTKLTTSSTNTFPAGWNTTSVCLQDSTSTTGRILSNQILVANNMTLEYCVNLCNAAGYLYCGAQYYSECWGGNSIVTSGGGGTALPASSCNYPCKGNANEFCGGSYIVTVFGKTGTTLPTQPSTGWSTTPQCIGDWNDRALPTLLSQSTNMTQEVCKGLCDAAGLRLCGVEYGTECYGGIILHTNTTSGSGVTLSSSSCNVQCPGNTTEICGGGWALSYFTKGTAGQTGVNGYPVGWGDGTVRRCVTDYTGYERVLSYSGPVGSYMTNQYCAIICDAMGYILAGTENANECYCANQINPLNGGIPTNACTMKCAGDSTDYCGGVDALTLLAKTGAVGPPYVSSLPLGWLNSSTCIHDTSSRVLTGSTLKLAAPIMTLDACVQWCDAHGWSYAGAEDGNECYCGNSIVTTTGGGFVTPASECNIPCGGAPGQICGGSYRLTMYQNAFPNEGVQAGWTKVVCSLDTTGSGAPFNAYSVQLPAMTPASCVATCDGKGYTFAGLEAGNMCYCGTYLQAPTQPELPSDCSTPCAGNSTLTCGGTSRMEIWSKAAAAVPASQQWTLEQVGTSGVVMTAIAVMNNETVLIYDRKEMNPLLDAQGDPAWGAVWSINDRTPRALNLISHAFCSAGSFLSNGTLINFGGHPETYRNGQDTPDGMQGVRFFDGCPASGSCEVYENYNRIRMAAKRWYPTSLRLHDGSVMLVGGSQTSSGWTNTVALAQNDYEFFPAKNINGYNGLPIPSQFLLDAMPHNLYPHMFTLPNQNLLVVANNLAMYLDWQTNTETRLPNLPNGQRVAYPFSGIGTFNSPDCLDSAEETPPVTLAVMLPLTPENKYTPEVIICGGSHLPNAIDPTTLSALTSPTSTQCSRMVLSPSGVAAGWATESMPEPRTLFDGVLLPTGQIIILNGARTGTAAYGTLRNETGNSNADNPTLTPVLYDPTAPVATRFSYAGMPSSLIPRMYHSSATLLPSGIIMIGGSNPNDDFSTVTYQSELRVEYLSPPYMTASRPTFSGLPAIINYAQVFVLSVTLPVGAQAVSVVLMDLGFVTHHNHMDQKLVKLVSTLAATTLSVVGPPSASVYSPGPGWIWVVVDGVPSIGQRVIIGTGADPPSDPAATANLLANTPAPNAPTQPNPPPGT